MAFTDDFAEALAEIDGDPELLPATFTWNGSDYACIASGATKTGSLEQFGYSPDVRIAVTVRGALFGDTRPARGHTFSVAGITYRVAEVTTAPGAAFLKIAGADPTKGI